MNILRKYRVLNIVRCFLILKHLLHTFLDTSGNHLYVAGFNVDCSRYCICNHLLTATPRIFFWMNMYFILATYFVYGTVLSTVENTEKYICVPKRV